VPRLYTWLLNAEENIATQTSSSFLLPNREAALFVQRLLPNAATSRVEPLIVTTQGRPGTVEKGKQEQRGVQLIESYIAPSRQAEFLHFMLPVSRSANGERPRVSALQGTARGLRIQWANGEAEVVLLRGNNEELSMNGERAVARVSPRGTWQRLILQRGTRLSRGSTELMKSTQPVSVAFQMVRDQKLHGTLYAELTTVISVSSPVRPRSVQVNGANVKSRYDEATDMVSFNVSAGTSVIEWDR
jgi:hypothetical protein